MLNNKRIDTDQMWRLLKKDSEDSPEIAPSLNDGGTLDVEQITTAVGVFQPRNLDGSLMQSEEHLKALSRVLADDKRHLDRIKVWWSGKRWYVVDGHHRLISYKAARRKVIPVVVLAGSLEDMLKEACKENSKDRLPMSLDDKSTMAWRMVCLTKQSKREISRACGISERQVAYMRKAWKSIMARRESVQDALPNLRWWQVRKFLAEKEGDPLDPDEKLRQDIEYMTKRLRKQHGGSLSKAPEVFAGAIASYDADLPKKLVESDAWQRLQNMKAFTQRMELEAMAEGEIDIGALHEGIKEHLGVTPLDDLSRDPYD